MQLAAEMERASAIVRVIDSGEGIAPDHLPFVFERFYKVDPARASASARSGLGLSIAKAIVGRHRGTIGVTSEPGRTIFRITLPQQVEQVVHATSMNL